MNHQGISREDESTLSWFLGEGETHFARSPTGPQIEHARIMSPNPVHDDRGNVLPDLYERWEPPEVTREGDTIDGPMAVARGAMMQDHDAQPTDPKRLNNAQAPDNRTLMRYASASSHLAKVDRADLQSGQVLRTYYGDAGARWGRTKWTRLFSIYPMTPAGMGLVERVERETPSPVFLTAVERLGVIAELQGVKPEVKAWRRVALGAANRQANEMFARACQCWVAVG